MEGINVDLVWPCAYVYMFTSNNGQAVRAFALRGLLNCNVLALVRLAPAILQGLEASTF